MSKSLEKICKMCGRKITWRKKWEKNWDAITYCSDSCRKNKVRPGGLDERFEVGILGMLRRRREESRSGGGERGVLTCEEVEGVVLGAWRRDCVAKKRGLEGERVRHEGDGGRGRDGNVDAGRDRDVDEDVDRDLRELVRVRERCKQAARRLAARGEIVIMQDGKLTDPSFTRGVMELRLREAG
jgi:hypothetical protein